MKTRREHLTTRFEYRRYAVACVAVACFFIANGFAAEQSYDIAITMRYPAGDKSAPQPTSLYVDSHSGDIFIADGSTSRIAIYDAQRRYSFEFSTRDRLSTPQQLAVDSLGRIFVMGDTRQHTLAVFDYNGDFLNYLDLEANGSKITPAGFAFDAYNNMYVAVAEPARIYVFTASGEFQRTFPILSETDDETRNTPMIGNFSIVGKEMFVPLPMVGQVARVDLNGKLIRIFGVPGGGPTELSFPNACCLNAAGEYVVLDKHRHLIMFFNEEGNYLREIGGAGLAEGWFYHPTSLVCCGDGTMLVGQIYNNRIQSVIFRNAPVVSGS